MKKLAEIIAIAGGNDAVVQNNFSTLVGMCLANFNKRCIFIDFDFNNTNLHQYLGIEGERITIDFFLGRSKVNILPTMHKNVNAIAFNSFDLASLDLQQQIEFFHKLKRLEADFVLLNLGSAATEFSLNAFLHADERFILTAGDVLSILDAYALIRSALLHNLARTFQGYPQLISALYECGLLVDGKLVKPLDNMATNVENISDEFYIKFTQTLASFRPRVVLTKVENEPRADDFAILEPIIKDLLSIEMHTAGKIDLAPVFLHDKSVDSQFLLLKSMAAQTFHIVVTNLLEQEKIDLDAEDVWLKYILQMELLLQPTTQHVYNKKYAL